MHAWYEKYDMSCSKMPNWSCFITKVCTIKPWGKARKPFLIPIHFFLFFQIFLSSHPILIILYSNSFFFTKILFFSHFFSTVFFQHLPFIPNKIIFSPFLFSISKYFFEENELDTHFSIFWFFSANKILTLFWKRNKIEKLFFFCIFWKFKFQSSKNHFSFWILIKS